MNATVLSPAPAAGRPCTESLLERYAQLRAATLAVCAPLSAEDAGAQSMPDASPAKWHLAHTTWFFERFVLCAHRPGYRPFHAQYDYLFNSYYEALGDRHPRAQRGLLTRPSLDEVQAYRRHVDAAVQELLGAGAAPAVLDLVELGLQHEQQHQELLLTDAKHLFAQNALRPAYRPVRLPAASAPGLRWIEQGEGIVHIGHRGAGFAFDNESPPHRVLLQAYALASRPVLNGEYREFVRAGGYRDSRLWLSDGWALVRAQNWQRPLYWSEDLGSEFTLHGEQVFDPQRPVCHLSWYEADAYARWAGARLPTEFEWEALAARHSPQRGQYADDGELHPRIKDAAGFYGSVWCWTASPYLAYPRYAPAAGAVGEYNGKFMCNQWVLRGGSCASPAGHLRATYRNFFHAHARWQFSGLRLAMDL